MGGCCPSGDSTTQEIDKRERQRHDEQKKMKKLLFLGTGSSGKSTLLKNLKEVNGQTIMDDRTLMETKNTMRLNVLTMMHNLCEKSVWLTQQGFHECEVDASVQEVVDAVTLIAKFGDNKQRGGEDMFMVGGVEDVTEEILPLLGDAVHYLWGLDQIRATYALSGGRFFMEENIDFFFDKCREIFKEDYVVSHEDVIKTRVRTTGVVTYHYEREGHTFEIIDVGGQRSERRKWVHQFAEVAAVVFVTALNHYNVKLFEAENENAMHDAIQLFETIANNKKNFEHTEIILFLNKEDLFRMMLGRGESLSLCFHENRGWKGVCWDDEENPNPWSPQSPAQTGDPQFEDYYEKALYFVQDRFLERNEVPRQMFTHVLCATQSEGMDRIFWDVNNIVIRANLQRGGLMTDLQTQAADLGTQSWSRPKRMQRDKKWSKGKVREKKNNANIFFEPAYESAMKDVPRMSKITVSTVSEKLKVTGSVARRLIQKLHKEGQIKQVYHRSGFLLYTRAHTKAQAAAAAAAEEESKGKKK